MRQIQLSEGFFVCLNFVCRADCSCRGGSGASPALRVNDEVGVAALMGGSWVGALVVSEVERARLDLQTPA